MFDINKLKPQTVHVITKQKPYISIRVNMSSWYQERIDISNINISMGYILRNVATDMLLFELKMAVISVWRILTLELGNPIDSSWNKRVTVEDWLSQVLEHN